MLTTRGTAFLGKITYTTTMIQTQAQTVRHAPVARLPSILHEIIV